LVDLLLPLERCIAGRLLFVSSQNQRGNEKGKQRKESTTNEKESHSHDCFYKESWEKLAAYPLWNETNILLSDDSPEKCPQKMKLFTHLQFLG
jgi:hypothetical protein